MDEEEFIEFVRKGKKPERAVKRYVSYMKTFEARALRFMPLET